MSNELEQLQAENAALREALEQTLLKTRERVVREIARAALSSPTPAAERIKALEEEHKLALTLCQRIDDTVGGVKDFAECVDHQSTAYDMWRNAVEKVGEE